MNDGGACQSPIAVSVGTATGSGVTGNRVSLGAKLLVADSATLTSEGVVLSTSGHSSGKHGHEHAHGHSHHGGHSHRGHHHGDVASLHRNRAFGIAVFLNVAFVAIEFGFGIAANSTALMADAGHNLSDVLGLLLAWGAVILGQRKADSRYTYGLRGASILAATANGILLVAACGAIALEAVQRFNVEQPVGGAIVTIVALVGIAINGISAWMLMAGSKGDLNLRGAFLHMVADAVVSLGVAISGVVMLLAQWYWLDSVVSLAIVAVILWATWSLLRESLRLSMNAVPAHIDLGAVQASLRGLPGVTSVADLHVWAISTTQNALTVTLVMPDRHPGDSFLDAAQAMLKKHHGIDHATLQIRQHAANDDCMLDE